MTANERQSRHCHHVERIAEKHHRPIASRPVSQPSKDITQAIAYQFTESRHEANDSSRRSGQREKRPTYAVRTLVGHIGEQTHHAKQHDKRHRCRHLPFLHRSLNLHSTFIIQHCTNSTLIIPHSTCFCMSLFDFDLITSHTPEKTRTTATPCGSVKTLMPTATLTTTDKMGCT